MQPSKKIKETCEQVMLLLLAAKMSTADMLNTLSTCQYSILGQIDPIAAEQFIKFCEETNRGMQPNKKKGKVN